MRKKKLYSIFLIICDHYFDVRKKKLFALVISAINTKKFKKLDYLNDV